MDLTKLTTSTLKSITGLTDKLSATIDELKKIEQTILASLSPEKVAKPAKRGPKPKAATVKAKSPAKKAPKATKAQKAGKASVATKAAGKRGAIKEQIVSALQKSGAKGVSVKELSEKLGVKTGNIHVWFATTGKTVGVEKVAPGVYRLKA